MRDLRRRSTAHAHTSVLCPSYDRFAYKGRDKTYRSHVMMVMMIVVVVFRHDGKRWQKSLPCVYCLRKKRLSIRQLMKSLSFSLSLFSPSVIDSVQSRPNVISICKLESGTRIIGLECKRSWVARWIEQTYVETRVIAKQIQLIFTVYRTELRSSRVCGLKRSYKRIEKKLSENLWKK